MIRGCSFTARLMTHAVWVRRSDVTSQEFYKGAELTVLTYREPGGDMIVLCSQWG